MVTLTGIDELIGHVLTYYRNHQDKSLFTVAISGIDASGKGYITRQLQRGMEAEGHKVAVINIDPWQNPIPVRLQNEQAAQNFYEQAIRWTDLFGQLIHPLQLQKSIDLDTTLIRTDADVYYPFRYSFDKPDILLVEGIFLLQPRFLAYYHCKVWIHCSFSTGIQRAIARNAENLSEADLLHAYDTWYYPAQRWHIDKDRPMEQADLIFDNDNYSC